VVRGESGESGFDSFLRWVRLVQIRRVCPFDKFGYDESGFNELVRSTSSHSIPLVLLSIFLDFWKAKFILHLLSHICLLIFA